MPLSIILNPPTLSALIRLDLEKTLRYHTPWYVVISNDYLNSNVQKKNLKEALIYF